MSHGIFRSLLELRPPAGETLDITLVAFHRAVSQFVGAWQPNDDDYATLQPEVSLLTQNHRKIYLVAAASISAGQFIYIDSTGKAAVASSGAVGTLAQGWSPRAVAANAAGEFVLFEGFLARVGVVAGTKYFSAPAGAIATTAGVVSQLIGVGIAADKLYVRIGMQ